MELRVLKNIGALYLSKKKNLSKRENIKAGRQRFYLYPGENKTLKGARK